MATCSSSWPPAESVTRVVAGRWGGRSLRTPRGATTRPTAEKIRAALGNALAAGGALEDAVVLDLYAGSGALGLELVSRGARRAVLVERDRTALTALRENAAALGGDLQVVAADVTGWAAGPGPADTGPFDVVVADPPYAVSDTELGAVIADLGAAGALSPGADLVVERGVVRGAPAGADTFAWPEPVVPGREKRYGDTVLCYGRWP